MKHAATKHWILSVLFSICILPSVAIAQKRNNKAAAETGEKRFSVMSVGVDYRAERDQNQSALPRAWPTFSFGLGQQPWMLSLEYARFNESSGNATLSVERKAETLILWGQWFADEPWPVQPYLGAGLGAYRNSADLNLYTGRTSAQGKWIEHAAGSFGLKLSQISPFWFAVEGRVHMNQELDPSPTVSGFLRFGFVIE